MAEFERKFIAALVILGIFIFPLSAEKFKTIEFFSHSREYSVKISYSTKSLRTFYKIYKDGKQISKFKTDIAPLSLIVSDKGSRLIAFCGSVGQSVTMTQIRIYSFDGKLLLNQKISASGTGGQDISKSHKYFIYAAKDENKNILYFFNLEVGRLLWKKSFSRNIAGVKIGSDDKAIAIIVKKEKSGAAVLNFAGKTIWARILKGKNIYTIGDISKGKIKLLENTSYFDKKSGYSMNKIVRRLEFNFQEKEAAKPNPRLTDKH